VEAVAATGSAVGGESSEMLMMSGGDTFTICGGVSSEILITSGGEGASGVGGVGGEGGTKVGISNAVAKCCLK